MATKPTLTIEELISAQQNIVETSTDPELQKKAMQSLAKLSKLKGDSQTVSLGDVRTEIKGLRTDLKSSANIPLPADSKQESDKDRTARLKKIGNVIESKTSIERGGARNESVMDRNRSTFDRFVTESSKREDLLKDASTKQVEIFQKLEETITKLREAGSDDSKELQDQISKLTGELGETNKTKAKVSITRLAENALTNSTVGERGNQGNLGDAWSALMGQKNVLKKGYRFDTASKSGVIGSKGGASLKDASMGPLAGAASIFGNFIGNKANKFVESKRSEGFQNFMGNNFRSSDLTSARLSGQQSALTSPSVKSLTPAALYEDSGSVEKASGDALTVQTMSKLLDELAKKLIEGGVGGNISDIGSALPDIDLPDKRGRGSKRAPKGKPSAKGASRIGSTLKSGASRVAPYAASAAIMYGVGRGIDAGAGALGVGKDAKGNDLVFDEKADEANWQKMSFLEKAESGLARGVETVGGLVVPNMANEAKSKRIKAENEYFAKQDKAKVIAPAPKTTGDKISVASSMNAAMKANNTKTVVINSNKPAAPAAPAQQIIQAPRGAVRPSESAMEKYADRTSHFF